MHDHEASEQNSMVTSCMLGSFRTRVETRNEFLSAINLQGGALRAVG
jgi:GTP cyclohydrolase I